MAFRSFEDLQVWQRSKTLAVKAYQTLEGCKDFGLKDQMQRAAISIPSNIVEGHERTPKDFARFLTIAIGSSSELRTQCYIAQELKIIENSVAEELIEKPNSSTE